MYLLSVILLSVAFQLTAGDCDAYNLPDSSTINRCHRVQECVDRAFFNNKNNQYIHEKVFLNTNLRSPIALVVKYNVTMVNKNTDNIVADDKNSESSGSGSDGGADGGIFNLGSAETKNKTTRYDDGNETLVEVSYVEELGWSTTGIYKAIRPVMFVTLKPVLYWLTLSFAIDNDGFPRPIEFDINIVNTSECNFEITTSEVKEALEHLTMKLNYKTTGKPAYIWNTDTTSLQLEDVALFASIALLAGLILLLLMVILTKLDNYNINTANWNTNALTTLFAIVAGLEILPHLYFMAVSKIKVYSVIRYYLGWAMLLIIIIGGIYGALTSCCFGKKMFKTIELSADTFLYGACFAFYLFPILIEAAVYPTEIISSTGYIVISVISMPTAYRVLKSFLLSGTGESVNISKKSRCCNSLKMALVTFCIYIIVPILLYILLIFYLSLLKLLFESPTSQLTQTLLTFLPPILVGLGSYAIKKLGDANDQEKSEPPTKDTRNMFDSEETDSNQISEKVKHGYSNTATEQRENVSDNSANSNLHQRSGKRRRSETGRQCTLQESSSQEMEVLVEMHQDNTSDIESESNA